MRSVAGPADFEPQAVNSQRYAEYDDGNDGLSFAELQQKLLWLVNAVWRSRWIMLAVILAALVLGAVVTLLTTPLYTAASSLQIDQQTERVLGTEDEQPAAAFQDADRFLQTNIEVLKSRATAVRVAQNLNLFSGNDFIEQMGARAEPDMPEPERREAILGLLDKSLAVDLPRNSRVARINFRSPDPALSARVANAYADNFITGNLQRKFNSTSYARSFLERQLVPARERLETSERELIAYARQAGLIDTQGTEGDAKSTNSNSITIYSLTSLNSAYAAATANRIAAEQRLRVAQRSPNGALAESYNNMGIQRLYEARAGRIADLQDELKRHKGDYPTVIRAKAAIAELTQQIDKMNGDIRRSITDQYDTARQQEAALAAEVERMKTEALAEKDRSVQYNTLRRDVDSNRSMYEALLQRYKEVSAASGISANNVSVVDRAEPPIKPTSPRLGLNLAIAMMLGLLIASAVAILRELLDDRVQNATDIEAKFGLPALGMIPQFASGAKIDTELSSARSVISEAYHSIATAVLLSSAKMAPKILMLTSAQSGEGKSSSAIGLSSAFARLNKRTLLIECDLRRPSLSGKFGEMSPKTAGTGLSEFLAGQSLLPGIHSHSKLRFDYLLAGAIPPDPIELLGSPAFTTLLRDLAGQYDQIILDAPPVLGLADAPILASRSDALIFVVEANRSHRGRAKAALNRIKRFDVAVIGTILTKVIPNSRLGYGYDLEYYSYR